MTNTVYSGYCDECGYKQARIWHGEPWRGEHGELWFYQECDRCGPPIDVVMTIDAFGDDHDAASDTITIPRARLRNALREAAAMGMGLECEFFEIAVEARRIADGILEPVEVGRFLPKSYAFSSAFECPPLKRETEPRRVSRRPFRLSATRRSGRPQAWRSMRLRPRRAGCCRSARAGGGC